MGMNDTIRTLLKKHAGLPVNVDEANKAVTFTLKPNQSFAVGYFRMFEGYMATPASMPQIGAVNADAANNGSAPGQPLNH